MAGERGPAEPAAAAAPAVAARAVAPTSGAPRNAAPVAAGGGRAGAGRPRRNTWPVAERANDLPDGARLVTLLDMMGGSGRSS